MVARWGIITGPTWILGLHVCRYNAQVITGRRWLEVAPEGAPVDCRLRLVAELDPDGRPRQLAPFGWRLRWGGVEGVSGALELHCCRYDARIVVGRRLVELAWTVLQP